MEIKINNEHQQLQFKGTAEQLLKQLKIRREEVVIKINGQLAPETSELSDSDSIEIIKVVFGG
ncbi:MAG: MoaD/ThiS family protein [Candidatus Micrarchaeota archaeon]|nr:MoaD/ThiS family protein [Candidatus Micrarchaeota archaeon]